MPPVLVVRLVRLVTPPTVPPKVVAPKVFTLSDLSPSTVLENSIALLEPVEVATVSLRSVTASPKVWLPVVASDPMSVVRPPLPVARSAMPVNVPPSMAVVPLKLSVRFLVLSPTMPLPNVGMVPVSVVLAPSVTAPV